MKNPFHSKVIPPNAPFCNRLRELNYLISAARSEENVVLYAPRRFGKTSLVRRVQARLADNGVITLFADFSGLGSTDEVAAMLARAVFTVTRKSKPLWKLAFETMKGFRPKATFEIDEKGGFSVSVDFAQTGKRGMDLLEDTLASIGEFIARSGRPINIALDEFQEIVDLKDGPKIEAAFRRHIQMQKASYFFVGSRRRILLGIFSDRQRPFFQSSTIYKLDPLPVGEMTEFIADLFLAGGKKCNHEMAAKIVNAFPLPEGCHPYYTQKLAHIIFDLDGKVDEAKVDEGVRSIIEENIPYFEGQIQCLTPAQRLVLKALAKEPTQEILAADYVARWRIGSVGGIRNSLKKLQDLDYVERSDNGFLRVVDPVFCGWLAGK